MGLVETLQNKKVYLDANIFIYAIEQHKDFIEITNTLFTALDKKIFRAFTSELSIQECLVKPLQDKNTFLENSYKDLFQDKGYFLMQEIHRNILIQSAYIRASSKSKTPDSIHLATAEYLNCDIFITNDMRIKSNTLEVVYLQSFT